MKKLFGYAIILGVLAVPIVSIAAEFRVGNQPSVRASEHVLNNLYMAGGSISSSGSVTGDLIAGGGNIVVGGDVGADVLAGGGNVTLLSNVGGDVRAAGGNILIEGKVGGDVVAGGGQITVGGPGIGGDVALGGGNVRIDAPVAGKLSFGGGSIFIDAPVVGDINIKADSVILGSAAVISGNMTYSASKELVQEPGAVIKGKINFEPTTAKMIPGEALAGILSLFLIWKFFALLACALLFGLILRRYSKEIVNMARERPLPELGRGLVAIAAIPVISFLFFFTLVGVPLGILGLLGFFALLLLTWIVTPIVVGSVVYRYFTKKDAKDPDVTWKTILIGVLVYTFVGFVPFLGWLADTLLMMMTFGCIVSLKLRIIKEWR
jgi:hypothetical protein